MLLIKFNTLGADRRKLMLGISFYGRTFTRTSGTDIGAPCSGPGNAGPYSREPGSMGYNELCEQQWTHEWDDDQQVPYAYKGNQWIGFDNRKSVELKCRFAQQLGLAGIMVWGMEADDFRGLGGSGQFPLLKTICSVAK